MTNSSSPPLAPKKSATAVLALLIAFLALLASALALSWLWRTENRNGLLESERSEVDARLNLFEDRLKLAEADLRATQLRLQDAATVNRNLRDELLGMTERAELLETAIKRVSDRSIDNIAELRLNNAELLMTAGLARLRLFRDTAGALAAMQWADAELATLHDPIIAGIRQSLAREIDALKTIPADYPQRATASLRRMQEWVATLPIQDLTTRLAETRYESNIGSRIRTLLNNFIRVRRLDEDTPGFIRPLQDKLARAQLRLQLLDFESTLLAGDETNLPQLLSVIENTAKASFDLNSNSGKSFLLELQALSSLPSLPSLEVVGSTLLQLRNLQETRQLAQPMEASE